jgi:hexosaminidase
MTRYLALLIVLLNVSCSDNLKMVSTLPPAVIPKPQKMELLDGSLTIGPTVPFYCANEFGSAQKFISTYFEQNGILLAPVTEENAIWVVKKDSLLPKDGYTLDINPQKIVMTARDPEGAFYAMQTMRQLLPPSFENGGGAELGSVSLPVLKIEDAPRFSYRGMHLDVGRHFFDKEFVKKYLDYLSMLKMNYFHWHLTEDQGWRIEIKKYPQLTAHAAYREETLLGHYNDTPQQFDGVRYGGFYTQEDIKEVVAYAQSLNITIIPEIEMPGHAQAAISAYPELGCTGASVPVATKWGVFEEVFCPKEETFTFLENVLSEVITLFPGPYIHIGGDEAPKSHWKNCTHCQALIKKEGLKDEHELQSYFIKRMESFLNEKGKAIIGWDEILEGGLAPNATVMSWRGTQGGIASAKQQHPVIMTPTSHCYFDYYQSEDPNEPLAIGGFVPLEKVYAFNPIPSELTAQDATFILGAQGNVWTEYMDTEKQVEYMVFPRILALSEVVWTGPSKDWVSTFPEFASRVESFHTRLDALGINYANHLYKLKSVIEKSEGQILYKLETLSANKQIKFRLEEGEMQTYLDPIPIRKNTVIAAQVYDDEEPLGTVLKDTILFHKGILGSITLQPEPHPNYGAGGKKALNNGRMGSASRYGDTEWLGFSGEDVIITLDLGKETDIHSIKLRFYNAPGQWIYAPQEIRLSLSADGTHFSKVDPLQLKNESTLIYGNFQLPNTTARILKLEIPNYGTIPDGQQGAGNKAWTFLDEIIVE